MAGQTKPSAIDDILAEHAGLEQQLSDPALHNDPAAARRVGKRFAELGMEIPAREQLTPQALHAHHKAEIEKWWPIIRAANIKVH